jgi:hypothetical protein
LAQWNSSSSNVPRFAANLSFSPIEPIKPSDGGQKLSSENLSTAVLQPSKAETVPEADFDWNTSGLVNPLDGKLINTIIIHRISFLLPIKMILRSHLWLIFWFRFLLSLGSLFI